MGKIYYYKLTVDNGGAPCVESDLLSLAICKPRIRTSAVAGDWIFGFAAKSLDRNNRLIYIAQVTYKEIDGLYYEKRDYSGRSDRIYRRNGTQYERRPRAIYHDHHSDLRHDLGKPPAYRQAQVLLSKNFRYFGASGTTDYKAEYPLVKDAVERLGQGERVNLPDNLRDQLMSLKDKIWRKFQTKICGRSHQTPDRTACCRTRSCGVVAESSKC